MGCGTVRPKPELLRLAAEQDRVLADPEARRPGRGAYVCGRDCAREAVRRRAFGRAFRRNVSVDRSLLDWLD